MSYITISETYLLPIERQLEAKNYFNQEANFFEKQIIVRIEHVLLFVSDFITTLGDTLIGIGFGIAVIVTAVGSKDAFHDLAYRHLLLSRFIVALPFTHLLQILNPNAKMHSKYFKYQYNGLTTPYAKKTIKNFSRFCINSDNILIKYGVARLTFVLLAIAIIISRIADAIIGILFGFCALITFGNFGTLNIIAYRGLQSTGIIKDTIYCVNHILMPSAGHFNDRPL